MYRILIADDEPSFCSWLSGVLDRTIDFQVVGEAHDGEDAIRQIQLCSPDVALLDVNMPGRDGFEVARYAREHFPAVTAIMVSAQDDAAYARMTTDSGASAFIAKTSLSLPALRALVQRVGRR